MRYRKKPVEVDAIQWTGHNLLEVAQFMGGEAVFSEHSEVMIETLEGRMVASPYDWIIRGIAGEYYPCKPEIFAKTYEAVAGE